MGDFFSDLGDQVLQPLGLTSSAEENAATRKERALQALEVPEYGEFKPEDYKMGEDYRKFITQQGGTEFDEISADPRLRDAQFGALDQMREIAESGGQTPEDRAFLDQIAREEGARERGSRGAIQQQAAARGAGGSGLEFLGTLGAAQNAATNRNIRDTDVAALAQRRALDAIRGTSDMAGSLRGQEHSEAAQRAQAQDVINRFNAGILSEAGVMTGQRRNTVRDKNTMGRNEAQAINKDLLRQQYLDEVARVQGISAADMARAGARDSRVAGGLAGSAISGVKEGAKAAGSTAAGGMVNRLLEPKEFSVTDEPIDGKKYF